MIFKDTSRFSPVAKGLDIPHYKDRYFVPSEDIPTKKREFQLFKEKYITDRAWWDRQRTRCINGFVVRNAVEFGKGDVFKEGLNMFPRENGEWFIPDLNYTVNKEGDIWIPGKMYFYLNFWKISIEDKFNQKKEYNHPWFTDLSWENWMLRKRAKELEKDTGWFKRRQAGLSEEEACDAGHDFLFLNDIQIAVVAEEETYNDNTFSMIKRGIWSLYNTQFFKPIKYDNDDLLSTLTTGTEIHNRTAAGNFQVLSGLNKLYKVHLEEIGIMREGLCREIAEAVKPSITTRGNKRTGFITYTGTSGKYTDGVQDIEKMIYAPESYELLSIRNVYDKDVDPESRIACFIPGWKFRIMDDDCNSLKEESIKNIKEERDKKDPRERAQFIAAVPIETKEMFDVTAGGYFGDFIIHHCNESRNMLMSHKKLKRIERGFLHYKDPHRPWEPNGVEWEPDEVNGDILIAEHPQKDQDGNVIPNLYFQGTDSYDQDESNTSSSKLDSEVYKSFNTTKGYNQDHTEIINNFVASYLDRPSLEQGGRETAFSNAAKLSVYYQCQNMIEYSKIAIFDHYINYGMEGYLAARPDFVIANMIDRSMAVNKYGFPGQLVPFGLTKLADWLKEKDNIYECPYEHILKAWAKFKRTKNYNCDTTIATMLCIVQLDEYLMVLQGEKIRATEPIQKVARRFKEVNGVIQEVWV